MKVSIGYVIICVLLVVSSISWYNTHNKLEELKMDLAELQAKTMELEVKYYDLEETVYNTDLIVMDNDKRVTEIETVLNILLGY